MSVMKYGQRQKKGSDFTRLRGLRLRGLRLRGLRRCRFRCGGLWRGRLRCDGLRWLWLRALRFTSSNSFVPRVFKFIVASVMSTFLVPRAAHATTSGLFANENALRTF